MCCMFTHRRTSHHLEQEPHEFSRAKSNPQVRNFSSQGWPASGGACDPWIQAYLQAFAKPQIRNQS